MSTDSQQLKLFAGDLNLTNMQLTSVQWETTLQRIAKDPDLQPNLRALTLDENDLGGVDAALAATIGRLERLMDLSICDARLSGVAVTRLLSALGTLPAFAKSHAEVWAPIEVMPGVPQGARLCSLHDRTTREGASAGATAAEPHRTKRRNTSKRTQNTSKHLKTTQNGSKRSQNGPGVETVLRPFCGVLRCFVVFCGVLRCFEVF